MNDIERWFRDTMAEYEGCAPESIVCARKVDLPVGVFSIKRREKIKRPEGVAEQEEDDDAVYFYSTKAVEEFERCRTSNEDYMSRNVLAKIGDLPKDHYLGMHPTREDEAVYCIYGPALYTFTPNFVKECYEAAKDGGNPLLDYLNSPAARPLL